MSGYDEERIAELLAVLPPAPAGWVEAAQELPRARAEISGLVERAQADAGDPGRSTASGFSPISRRLLPPRASSRGNRSSSSSAGASQSDQRRRGPASRAEAG